MFIKQEFGQRRQLYFCFKQERQLRTGFSGGCLRSIAQRTRSGARSYWIGCWCNVMMKFNVKYSKHMYARDDGILGQRGHRAVWGRWSWRWDAEDKATQRDVWVVWGRCHADSTRWCLPSCDISTLSAALLQTAQQTCQTKPQTRQHKQIMLSTGPVTGSQTNTPDWSRRMYTSTRKNNKPWTTRRTATDSAKCTTVFWTRLLLTVSRTGRTTDSFFWRRSLMRPKCQCNKKLTFDKKNSYILPSTKINRFVEINLLICTKALRWSTDKA